MHEIIMPEEMFGDVKTPLLIVAMTCRRCGLACKETFEYAFVNPDIGHLEGWDGISLPRIVECKYCGALDDYELDLDSRRALLLGCADGENPRVKMGLMCFLDGTFARRPYEGLLHLRDLTKKYPGKSEPWWRLGNFCGRQDRWEEAEAAWGRALEIDPCSFNAAYSLSRSLSKRGKPGEAFHYMQRAFRIFFEPKYRDAEDRPKIANALLFLLRRIADAHDKPIALMAAWSGGTLLEGRMVVNLSSVDLRKVRNWERLEDLIASPELLSLTFTHELPDDEPTRLQMLLEERQPDFLCGRRPKKVRAERQKRMPLPDRSLPPSAPVPNGAQPRRVGRNDRCQCGSARKYKKCCGNNTRQGVS